ncbi:hypothetical protein WHR41_08845 [Cladosporium halotolerans]|uniref:Uncharacterized protein n=1 Tax=Cladosporium halotolerans TaxID=1052096 RepID=A0AB34KEJ4_9PEZI
MPTFAPPYRPTKSKQPLLAREQKREARKRKREENDETDSDASSSDQSSDSDASTPKKALTSAPVNKTDPFHVAGLSREQPLPRHPFPHAPVKSAERPKRSSEEELAAVKPPLYVPKKAAEDESTSLKRRHLDNLAAILHRCMLKGDWERASRAWGLLARTEVGGLGIDVRQHGRWGIGAEILMRREQSRRNEAAAQAARRAEDDESLLSQDVEGIAEPNHWETQVSDEGFKLAREYYERLILQYPYTPHTQHTVNARVFYPALFNVWVYEVQARYKHLRDEASRNRRSSPHSIASDDASDRSDSPSPSSNDQDLTIREIEDIMPIKDRLDQLLLSPPYDISEPLLHLRGMMGIWLSDLYVSLASSGTRPRSGSGPEAIDRESTPSDYQDRVRVAQYREKAAAERSRAKELLSKVKADGRSALDAGDLGLEPTEDMSE